MRVVVTGGAGFIGANLVHTLGRDKGIEILAVDDLSSGFASNLSGYVRSLRVLSILDLGQLVRALRRADTIVHLAAMPSVPKSIKQPLASHNANATGTLNVLEAARRAGTPHVIVASSSSVYGGNPDSPKRESARPMPVSPYAASKLAAEAYSLAYAHSFGQEILTFRFFNVFGPLQAPGHAYAAVVPAFVDAALANRPLRIHGDGKQTRDFTYVGTVVDVIVDAIRRRVTSDAPVNLAFGTHTSINDLASHIETHVGRALKRTHVAARSGDVRDSQADSTSLRSLFPHVAPISLDDGLRHTLEWFTNGGPGRQR